MSKRRKAPTAKGTKMAREMTAPYRQQINENDALMSLLYDIDLLPEQIVLPVNAVRMSAVCEMFKLLTPEAVKSLLGISPTP